MHDKQPINLQADQQVTANIPEQVCIYCQQQTLSHCVYPCLQYVTKVLGTQFMQHLARVLWNTVHWSVTGFWLNASARHMMCITQTAWRQVSEGHC